MKRIISSIMVILLVLSTTITAFAADKVPQSEVIFSGQHSRNMALSSVTIGDIDQLVDERNEAYLNGDNEEVERLTNELHSTGMGTISLDELNQLTGENKSDSKIAARSGATFETVYSTYTHNGITYDIMRIYATPTTSSNLYYSGVTALKNSSSATANSMKFISIVAQATAGLASDSLGAIQTVYGALRSSISALSSTSTINNISSSYTWNAAETCVFVYVKSTVTGNWVMGAQYSKASSTVTTVTPTLEYDSNGAITSAITKTYSGTATPTYYNNTYKAVSEYLGAGLYDLARVNKIVVKGIQGKKIKTINLLNPDTPGTID